jgi:glycosyltransferase involved in cell wall biosynthesis
MKGGSSAYSRVTYETSTRLAKAGHKVAHIPMGFANKMGKTIYEDVVVYNSGQNAFSEDVSVPDYCDFNADMLITIKENWNFNYIPRQAINWVPMVVCDHSPISESMTRNLESAFKIISVSRHAQMELMQKKIESTYIPHGVNTSVFKPLDKAKCKKLWHLDPDDFTVLIVAMNRARKLIPRQLQGYKLFLEQNPGIKSHLMLWTNVYPNTYPESDNLGVADVGVSLLPEIMRLDLGEAVRWVDPKTYDKGIPDWAGEDYENGYDMTKLYNCADVVLNCTGGEGASLSLFEGQSCGVPVITTNYAAAPEHVGSGYTVPWHDYVILNTPGTRFALADLGGMSEALTKVYNGNRVKMAERARNFALRYDWDRVVESHWKPFLQQCGEELFPKWTSGGLTNWST